MKRMTSPRGITISWDEYGSGPPLVLVHGSFSDHRTNWEFVKPLLEQRFTVHAVARRGRGETDPTEGHRLEDEGMDIAELIQALGEPVFLLGHSYGAQTALAAAARIPAGVRKLVLYEPPLPGIIGNEALARLEHLARTGNWDELAFTFFRDCLFVPVAELEQLRTTDLWAPIITDAEPSLGDLRGLHAYDFRPERFCQLARPVMLQVGSDSLRHLYVTDALAAVLPDCRVETLAGQAHEGMTTAPEMYAAAVTQFLLA